MLQARDAAAPSATAETCSTTATVIAEPAPRVPQCAESAYAGGVVAAKRLPATAETPFPRKSGRATLFPGKPATEGRREKPASASLRVLRGTGGEGRRSRGGGLRPCVGQDSLSAAYGGVSPTSRLVGGSPALGLGCGVDDLQHAQMLGPSISRHARITPILRQ
jgi:hypothetical protein